MRLCSFLCRDLQAANESDMIERQEEERGDGMERLKKLKAEDYDRVSADEEDAYPSPWEPVYRDGSAKNECWHDDWSSEREKQDDD